MQLQITLEELKNYKSRDLIPLKCEQCDKIFNIPKNDIQCILAGIRTGRSKFCSKECQYQNSRKSITVTCLSCKKEFTKLRSEIIKTPNHFCNRSCSAKYNNAHKKSGYRRSKLELYIEQQLKLDYPTLDIRFNDRSIGYELDVYIPSLKLAFEINGIHHYKPIWKNYKRTIEIDKEKLTTCLEYNIRLFVYDISTVKHFKPEIGLTYLNLIKEQISIGTKC